MIARRWHTLALFCGLILAAIAGRPQQQDSEIVQSREIGTITSSSSENSAQLSEEREVIGPAIFNQNLTRRYLPPHRGFPGGPIFVNFPDAWTVDRVRTAFSDSMKLALAAVATIQKACLSNPDPTPELLTYIRYFAPSISEQSEVELNLQRLLGPPNAFGQYIGPADQQRLTVYFGERPPAAFMVGDVGTLCATDLRMTGEFAVDSATGDAVMLLCPSLWAVDRPRSLEVAISNGCASISGVPDISMYVPGSTVFHELLHWWGSIGYASKGPELNGGEGRIVDWNAPQGESWYNAANFPPHGYGAYNSMLVNQLNHAGSWNADNYRWFALESYFSQHCPPINGKPRSFGTPLANWLDVPPAAEDIIQQSLHVR